MAPGSTPHIDNLEGIDNPFEALGASLFVFDEAHLLDRYLGSQTEGNTYCSCAASPFPLRGKKTNASPVSVNVSISGTVVWEVAIQYLKRW